MKPSVASGIFFGLFAMLNNLLLAPKIQNKFAIVIIMSGLMFFCSYFSILFTKRQLNYQLTFLNGLRASIQSGILMGICYCISIVLLQKVLLPNYIPNLDSLGQYFFHFNIYIILFSIISLIFGALLSSLLMTKTN